MIKVRHFFFLCWLLSVPLLCEAKPTEEALAKIYGACRQTETSSRIECLGQHFLGKPYLADPLGEGPHGKFSRQPLLRSDGFDCQTYVETVLALARAEDASQVPTWMNRIRYRNGHPSFFNRHHFMDIQWVPSNEALSLLRNTSAELFPIKHTPHRRVYCNQQSWYRHLPLSRIQRPDLSAPEKETLLQTLHQHASSVSNKTGDLAYLPLRHFFSSDKWTPPAEQHLQSGSVVLIVRHLPQIKALIGTDLCVTHMGFLIRRDNTLFLRHASSDLKKVIEAPLESYLRPYLQDPHFKGLAFLTLLF